jgi:hypothetical protein
VPGSGKASSVAVWTWRWFCCPVSSCFRVESRDRLRHDVCMRLAATSMVRWLLSVKAAALLRRSVDRARRVSGEMPVPANDENPETDGSGCN